MSTITSKIGNVFAWLDNFGNNASEGSVVCNINNALAATFLIGLFSIALLGGLYVLVAAPLYDGVAWLAARPVLAGSIAWLAPIFAIMALCNEDVGALLVFVYFFASVLLVALVLGAIT